SAAQHERLHDRRHRSRALPELPVPGAGRSPHGDRDGSAGIRARRAQGGMMSLPAEVYVPGGARDGIPVVVLLHGRGADRTDLFSLRRFLPSEWAVVAPDAPFAAAPWGYGPGRAWYRYLGRNRPEPDSFQRSLDDIDELLADLDNVIGHAPGPIALGGFSQGGTVSVGYALSHPGRVEHIINFSGFLADHPSVSATPETVAGTRFWWGHGTADPSIPF